MLSASAIAIKAGVAWVGSILGEFVTDWREGRQNKRAIKKAVTENKVRLAKDKQTHNQNWEMASLENADIWLRRISFFCWSFPIFWAVFDPDDARNFFEVTLAHLPEWYKWGYLAITGSIWGVAELKARGVIK